jgi:predicted metal-dependent peptidase
VEQWANPKVDWRARLREFIEMTTRGDYDWLRADRAYLQRGMYVPDLYSNTMPLMAVAFDTSGSVGDEEVAQFFAELNSILEEFQETEVLFIQCDSRVNSFELKTSEDLPLEPKVYGRGGTRFIPVFEAIEESEHTPVCLVYCSDMECGEYPPEPEYPVLWLSTQPLQNVMYLGELPFGEVLEIDVR